MKKIIQVFIFFSIAGCLFGQSAKQCVKAGNEFMVAKNYKDAIAQFSKAIEIEPKKANYYTLRADAYEKSGDLVNAYEDVKRAIVFDDNTDTRVQAGRLAYLLKKYDEALTQLDKALELKRSNNDAYEYKIRIFIIQQDYNKAQEVCKEALKNKETAINYYLSATVLDNLGNFENSETAYKKAISKDKKYEDAYVGLADLLIRLNKLTKPCNTSENCWRLIRTIPMLMLKEAKYLLNGSISRLP